MNKAVVNDSHLLHINRIEHSLKGPTATKSVYVCVGGGGGVDYRPKVILHCVSRTAIIIGRQNIFDE